MHNYWVIQLYLEKVMFWNLTNGIKNSRHEQFDYFQVVQKLVLNGHIQ